MTYRDLLLPGALVIATCIFLLLFTYLESRKHKKTNIKQGK